MIYLLLSSTITLPLLYPHGSLAWNLCGVVAVIIIERQLLRGWAIKKVYGWRSMSVACLLPPLVPVRMVWGYIINLSATLKAWHLYLYHRLVLHDDLRSSAPPWDKTEHEFLDKATLKRYHRKLGDTVLAKKLISAQELKKSLIEARTQGKRLGAVLKENRLMSEVDLLTALSQLQHTIFLPLTTLRLPDHSLSFGWDVLEKVQAVPLLRKGNTWAVAISDESPDDARDLLERACGGQVYLVYSTVADITVAMLRMRITLVMPETAPWAVLQKRLEQGQFNFEQVLLAVKYSAKMNLPIESVLEKMGLGKAIESALPGSEEISHNIHYQAQ
jgi:adsorption protein B